jgi:diacylglycerol kinase family enzyme
VRVGDTRCFYFGFALGVGFLASVANERYHIRCVRGQWLYLLAALRAALRRQHSLPLAIGFDGEQPTLYQVLALSVNNSPTVGGFPLSPDADMSDGELNILTLGDVTPLQLIRVVLAARSGDHMELNLICRRRCRCLRLVTSQPFALHVDGQLTNVAGPLKIQLLPAALRVAA